jgi:hypothetical protein
MLPRKHINQTIDADIPITENLKTKGDEHVRTIDWRSIRDLHPDPIG